MIQDLQTFNEWYQVSGLGYWLATISSLVWSVMYFWLRRTINRQFAERGELIEYYNRKALDAKKTRDKEGYMLAVRVLSIEQQKAPLGVCGRIKKWLNVKLK